MGLSQLPPLSALRAFEATARLASFKAAAEELRVTPTAISHQIRQLESWLGCRVLDRSPRAVTLTAPGRILHDATTAGFGAIERAVARLRDDQGRRTVLTLSATTAFLSHWLMPRIQDLRRAVPGVDLRLHASDRAERLQAGGIDVAIRYGAGPFAGAIGGPLCQDELFPVCSPALAITRPEHLREAPLIHIDGRSAPSPAPDWARWCVMAGLADADTAAGAHFPDSMLAVQAAIAGQGVAIVSRLLVADALSAGLLHAPFAQRLTGDAYHFLCAPGLEQQRHVIALRAWFDQAMGTARPDHAARG
jgi:LysR family transcriptional regulator, glycine cleavage system transcriptional activator